jgi:hypothetical protein
MNLFSKLRNNVDQNIIILPTLLCKVFEDNSGAYDLATTPKMQPRTKHTNVKCHHFRAYVEKEKISLKKVAYTSIPPIPSSVTVYFVRLQLFSILRLLRLILQIIQTWVGCNPAKHLTLSKQGSLCTFLRRTGTT